MCSCHSCNASVSVKRSFACVNNACFSVEAKLIELRPSLAPSVAAAQALGLKPLSVPVTDEANPSSVL